MAGSPCHVGGPIRPSAFERFAVDLNAKYYICNKGVRFLLLFFSFYEMNPTEELQARARASQMQHSEQLQQKQEQQRLEMEARNDQRRAIVRSVLEPEALERLNRIGLVKPEKQTRLEEVIFANVQRGSIKQKIDEGTFVHLLQQIEQGETGPGSSIGGKAGGSIQFKRRAFDEDSDIDLDNLE